MSGANNILSRLYRAEIHPSLERVYDTFQDTISRSSSSETLLGAGSEQKWKAGLKDPARYKRLPIVYSTFDNGPTFGQPEDAHSVQLRIADDSEAPEDDMDAVIIVQVAVPVAINYCPYDIILSHPALDQDIPTMHGVRRGFMVIPAAESALTRAVVKHSIYDGHAVLDSIANNRSMCQLLETLRYIIRTEDGHETLIDILRPETLKNHLHIASDVENGRLRDTYRYVNERHPYIKLLREPGIKSDVERPEADGGFNFALDRKVKLGKKEIESKRGSGNDSSHLIPVPVIEHIEKWYVPILCMRLAFAERDCM